jgi:hypothetical protein
MEDQVFYENSNGDFWCLTNDPASGRLAVMHRPNDRSGGKTSYIDVDDFLRENPDGPQQQALKSLMEAPSGR